VLALTYRNFAAEVLGSSSRLFSRSDDSRVSKDKPHTILVVEDVDEISANMTAALKQRGHRVEQASNAEQAIQMAEENRPALILTDLDLPTFNQLLNLLLAHADLKNMPVAIMDINHPKVDHDRVNVLHDFQALDDLIQSSQQA
jgi:PleD family two-component response regulator